MVGIHGFSTKGIAPQRALASQPVMPVPVAPVAKHQARRARSRLVPQASATATPAVAPSPAAPTAHSSSSASNGVAAGTKLTTAGMSGSAADLAAFTAAARSGANIVPLVHRLFSDQLTPVMAYRCLVKEDDTSVPSFLFESVVNGDQQGRYSFVGAMPAMEVVATQGRVVVMDHEKGTREVQENVTDPMQVPETISREWRPAQPDGLPAVFTGGFVGYAGYDTVRYVYSGKLPFQSAPKDDRHLPDLHLALYNDVVVFDQATKIIYAISWVHLGQEELSNDTALSAAYHSGAHRLQHLVSLLNSPAPPLSGGSVSLELTQRPSSPGQSNMTKDGFLAAVLEAKEHILAGDIFQLVMSQRFERRTFADPFEVYRALRVVNPSPYMVYMQVTNRPLAGTRRRGTTPDEDVSLERELLADAKECAEHVMLVDLGRNDVGKVSVSGSVKVEKLMEVERYSHVMHISSTVTGSLLPELDSWDALRAALPAGTVSGAPKVSAMQIIDRLELTKRGPYGGGFGHVSFTGSMDMALGLRTIVIPTGSGDDTMYQYRRGPQADPNDHTRREWVMHLQAGAGLVADSVPEAEYEETVNKAAALGRAIDLAEQAFVRKHD